MATYLEPQTYAAEVKEGMLCPRCLQDLVTIQQLQDHFERVHSSDDQDVLQPLKNLIGKAKRKIFKQEGKLEDGVPGGSEYEEESDMGAGGTDWVHWEPQEAGMTVRHTEYFKRIRRNKMDRYVIEVNKLIIRLDKLITDVPPDPEKRKAHERSIVPWIADADVRLCPGCARPFNLSRRRHHCRLCGGIMCHNCSEFLDFNYARKLTLPSMNVGATLEVNIPRQLQRRGSSSSLMSMVNATGDPHIRSCHDCKRLLDCRDQQMEQRTSKTILTQMYERMTGQVAEAEKLIPVYAKMVESLGAGEPNYSLSDAQGVRMKLQKLAENIDIISKKIAALGTKDDPPPDVKQLQLQNGVRRAASNFLRNNMLGLPQLPTEEELLRLQDARRQMVRQRIEQEKQAAARQHNLHLEFRKKDLSPDTGPSLKYRTDTQEIVTPDTGWTPSSAESPSAQNADPLLQQMNNIRNYIRQAREADRYDEIQMLETNLKELQEVYWKQRPQN